MEGIQKFQKMQEITKHLSREAEWWKGEGLDPSLIATVLRSVAEKIDQASEPKTTSWPDQWRSSEGYRNAMDHIAKRRAKYP